ncbi:MULTISPECIES: MBL fold metallo-hydrolase [unclassified Pseudovibrio]|uniref:MBL fold metallo-hydrolase n=1 Tax=unclassified Pseudovibrio TaxID=2627060 RepID=UPI0007AE7FE0|nr:MULTISPECIES: MBL fold metallo-hydrolase [unclassified Pseudovibrio]KZK94280.1 Hydroxyacylglutathione hydrolase [Pseudovibrio sp. W74]KZL09905.1 Hydroxyacylglutathione hydrolase [Pseudovibrio sp. Ad14]
MIKSFALAASLAATATLAPVATYAQDTAALTFEVYNPSDEGLFPVTSVLIEGPKEAVLVDAQFQRRDARNLISIIKESGKTLTSIYISHGDPDYYFGLDALHAAFPDAKIVATQPTVEKIKATIEGKFAYWGPILKDDAPQELIVPEVIDGNSFEVDGTPVEIVGLDGHDPSHTSLWVPSERTVVGGVLVYDNSHIWQADNPTSEKREDWQKSLDDLLALNPKRVIPGHFLGNTNSQTVGSIAFTKAYVAAVEKNAALAKNSDELVTLMKTEFPALEERRTSDLALGAKVVMGEMKWPAE